MSPVVAKAVDTKKLVADIKQAVAKVKGKKDNKGDPLTVFFAFSADPKKKQHDLRMHPRLNDMALLKALQADHKDRKGFATGTAAVVIENGKTFIELKFKKKLAGGHKIIEQAMKSMALPYKCRLANPDDDDADDDAQASATGDDDDRTVGADDDDAGADDSGSEDAGDDDATAESADDADEEESDGDEDGDDSEAETEGASDDEEDEEDDEDEEEEEEAPAAAAPKAGAAAPITAEKLKALKGCTDVYAGAHKAVAKQFEMLKAAVNKEYGAEDPALKAEINKGLAQLDQVFSSFDHSIADELDKAHAAKDEATRRLHLERCKALHAKNIKALASNQMLKHVENNPFVKIPVLKTYALSFQHIDTVLKKT